MDPLIIRVSPTVLLVGSTTYTAKIKLGYRFNGFHVNVTGVGIPIYREEVDIGNKSTTNKSATGNSDAYDYVEKKACAWMDELEKSMISDSKEKNVVDLLREIKYQMHFDASGHKYPAIVPGTDEYDARMEVCTEVPTYIEDLYTMLLQITIRLDNLTSVINGGQLKKLREDSVEYNQETGKFVYHEDNVGNTVKGLNERIEELNDSIGTGKDEGQTKESLQSRITKLQESIGDPSDGTVMGKLDTVGTNVNTVATNVDTVASDVVALSTQSATNATTISNAITSGLNQLVAQMTTMNGRIGTPRDSYQSDTLFGKIDITNTRIGDPANNTVNTLFDYLDDIKSAPILNADPDVGMDADHVMWLNYWVQDVYRTQDASGHNLHPMHDAMYDFFYKTLSGESDICTSKKLDSAVVRGKVCWDYETGTAANNYCDRGFYHIDDNNRWGMWVHCNNA
jgi:hypothetical protein